MQIPEKLLDYLQPSLWSLDAAHLDSGKCLVQLLGDRSHFVHAAWEADLFAVVNNLSNRRDNSSSTAKTALCEVFYFIEVYFSFLCLKSKVFLGNIDQGTACDGWKDTVRLRCYNLAVFCYGDVYKRQPPVSSTLVRVLESRYMFSSNPFL